MTDLNDPLTALQIRDSVLTLVRNEIVRLSPQPRWGKVLDINQGDRTARVLFPNDTTPAIVKFSLNNSPSRGLNTDPNIDYDAGNPEANDPLIEAASVEGDVVRVEGTPGNLWITDVVSGVRPWQNTFLGPIEPTDERTDDGPIVPVIRQEGDLWIDESDGNKIKRWTNGAWELYRDLDIELALDTADGKNKIFIQGTAPTATAVGDTWIDTATGNALKTWSGSAWVIRTFGQGAITALSITAAEIAAGTIIASRIAAGTITANEIAAGTITANRIATGTITAASGVIGSLSASTITTGTLNASLITVTNLNANSISSGTLSLTSGSNTASFGATGVEVVTGSTTLTIDTDDGLKIVDGAATTTMNELGLTVVETSVGMSFIDGTGVGNSNSAGTINFDANYTGANWYNSTNGNTITINITDMTIVFDDIHAALNQRGTVSLSASSATSASTTVTFSPAFRTNHELPQVYVNIPQTPGAGGAIPRPWVARAYNISRTGCSIVVYSVDTSSATFTDEDVNWVAIGGRLT